MTRSKTAKIVLEDNSQWVGMSFGAERSVAGEVVFNTALTGYPESLTDPSYNGQILTLTYPMIGNYGVPEPKEKNNLLQWRESERIHVSGLIISEYSEEYYHWNADQSLSNWLKNENVPGIFGIDTRALTKKLRENGTMLGKLIIEDEIIDYYNPNKENLADRVSIKKTIEYGSGRLRIILIDCGVKYSIIHSLLKFDTTVIRTPWDYDYSKEEYDGIFISNGPGNPKFYKKTIQHIERSLESEKPIFGICLGNQLLGLACGAKTYKLKYGHRSHNQPVILQGTNDCFITSQNHGFAIDTESLPPDWQPLFTNLNDGTCEGIKHKTKPFYSAQFHPEASGGPVDTEFFFQWFIDKVKQYKMSYQKKDNGLDH